MPKTAADALTEAADKFAARMDPNCECGTCPNCIYGVVAFELRGMARDLQPLTAVPAQRIAA